MTHPVSAESSSSQKMSNVTKLVEASCAGCGNTYLRKPRSRTTLCCKCRTSKRAQGGGRTIRVLPVTDLAPNAIQSDMELQQYLSMDQLQCLVCGTFHKGLYAHLRRAHGMNSREYKIKYGIPVTTGLVGQATREKMQLNAQITLTKMRKEGFDNLKKARSNRGDTRVPWTTYHRAAQSGKMVSSENHPQHQEGTTVLYCKQCGGEVYVDSRVALAIQCRVVCDTCKGNR